MSWWSLYVKELRLTKHKFLINVGGLFIVAIILFVLGERYNPLFLIPIIPILIIVHFFYLFFAMLDSLRQEWKQKTSIFWLNIPSSGFQLLTAKFVAAMSQLFISLSTTFIIVYLLLLRSVDNVPDPAIPAFIVEQFQSFWWVLFFVVFIGALQLGTFSTFIYMMAKSIRKWGWLLGIVIVAVANWLWSTVQETAVYKAVTEWGAILSEEELINSFIVHFDSMNDTPTVDIETMNEVVLYFGSTLVNLLVIVAILYTSAWLLDHKVEA